MYEALVNRINAISSSLSLPRSNAKMTKNDNPWGYSSRRTTKEVEEEGRELEVLEKPKYRQRAQSFESDMSDVTVLEKDTKGAF
jgi:hypothetical protein